MSIVENFLKIKKQLPENITIVAVSKTKPPEAILELYNIGYKIFGENKVQEMLQKKESLPQDIQWHMIGHLQTNKVKYIAPFVSLIHSVDSVKLLKEINKRGQKNNRTIPVLLEIHIAKEESKFGLTFQQAEEIFKNQIEKNLPNVNIIGLMGMATYTSDTNIIDEEFKSLKNFFDYINKNYRKTNPLKELSMGMSNDYMIAVKYGATIVRIGSKIFGARN